MGQMYHLGCSLALDGLRRETRKVLTLVFHGYSWSSSGYLINSYLICYYQIISFNASWLWQDATTVHCPWTEEDYRTTSRNDFVLW